MALTPAQRAARAERARLRAERANAHGPRAGHRSTGRPHSDLVEKEQKAMNEVMRALYPPPQNPRLLKEDGIAGTATNAMRSLIARAFTNPRPPEGTAPTPLTTEKLNELRDFLKSPAGEQFRMNPTSKPVLDDFQQNLNAAPEDRPGSGFQQGTGAVPDPSLAAAATPAAGTPAAPEGTPAATPEAAPAATPTTAAGIADRPVTANLSDFDIPADKPGYVPSAAEIAGVTGTPAAAPAAAVAPAARPTPAAAPTR